MTSAGSANRWTSEQICEPTPATNSPACCNHADAAPPVDRLRGDDLPDLGRQFYDLGPGRAIASLTTAFARLGERGLLNAPDPARAASDYNWLVMSDPLNRP